MRTLVYCERLNIHEVAKTDVDSDHDLKLLRHCYPIDRISEAPKRLGYFPFQQLPLELRIMVYSYLIPDKIVPEYRNPTARIRRGRLNTLLY